MFGCTIYEFVCLRSTVYSSKYESEYNAIKEKHSAIGVNKSASNVSQT